VSIYKRGNVYWYHFTFAGRRVQASTKVANRKAALEIERCVRTDMAKGLVGLERRPKQNRTIGELMDVLEGDFKMRGKCDARNESNFRGARGVFPGRDESCKPHECRCRSLHRKKAARRLRAGDD
jgi:hypothetical protein